MPSLPDFKLETYFSKWEFNVKFNMCASDTEAIPMRELLDMASEEDKKAWENLHLGYTETYGSPNCLPNDLITNELTNWYSTQNHSSIHLKVTDTSLIDLTHYVYPFTLKDMFKFF